MKIISLIPAILLALTHISLHTIEVKISNKDGWHWLSIPSGISAAYVFLGLIPDLEKYKYTLNMETEVDTTIDHRFYAILMLVGFTIFYTLESLVKHHRKRKTKRADTSPLNDYVAKVAELLPCENKWIFTLHILCFSIYDAVITFLLPIKQVTYGPSNMWFYYVAMQCHFVLDDMALHDHFGTRYDKFGRIPLLLATIMGYLLGFFWEAPRFLSASVAAFIAGGTVINIMKEELPAESRASVPLFMMGAVVYALLIVFLY